MAKESLKSKISQWGTENSKSNGQIAEILMKRRTKDQKLKDCFDAFKAIKEGRPVKRQGAKDGSIPTHPVVEVYKYPESVVLLACLTWLRQHNIFCNRHDSGSFHNEHGQWGTYGIKGAGDIIGLLKTGQHFELEIKRGAGGRLSLEQQKRMKQIRENNGLYFIIHGVEELGYYMGDLI